MTEVQTAIVVGGGIAGPVAALALRKAGIAATVYEAYPSPAAGIAGTLGAPNGPGPQFTGLLGFEAVARHDVDAVPGTMTFAFGKRGYYLYWPEPGGGTRWGVNLPQERPISLTAARAVPSSDWMRTLRAAYADDDPGRDLMLTSSPDELQVVGSLQIMPRVRRW